MHVDQLVQLMQPYTGVLLALVLLFLILPWVKGEIAHAVRIFVWWNIFNYTGAERLQHAIRYIIQRLGETNQDPRGASQRSWQW
jgi:hypothetical protein